MAVALQTIKRIEVRSSESGTDQVAAKLRGLSDAQTRVSDSGAAMATVTDMASRRSLSAAEAYRRQTLALDEGARAQDKIARATKVAHDALAQGKITQDEYVQRLALINEKYAPATAGTKAWGAATQGISAQLVALSAGAGPVGVFLSALGPWGIAAAVGLGAAAAAFNEVRTTAADAGKKAEDLRNLAEATHSTIDEIRGLKKIAGEFGVGAEQLETWLTKAAISTEQARLGSGDLVDALNKVSPAFQKEMESTRTLAQSLDVLSAAAKSAKEQGKDVALFWRDVFGRGSGRADPVFAAVQLAGGVEKLGEESRKFGGAAAQEIEARALLSRAIEVETAKREALKATMIGAATVLELELAALKKQNAALQSAIDWKQRENATRTETILLLEREVQARIKGSDAEELVNRARARNRVGVNIGNSTPAQDAFGIPAVPVPAAAAPGVTGLIGPTRDYSQAVTQAFNDTARWMAVLGSGATIQQTAALALQKLDMEFHNNADGLVNVTEKTRLYNQARSAIILGRDIQIEGQRLSLLGELAPVSEVVAQAQNNINKAIAEGATFTEAETAAIVERNRVQAQNAKPENQLAFEKQMLLVLDQERQIQERIRGLNIDITSERGRALAAEMRIVDAMKSVRDIGRDAAENFTKGFVSNLMQGKSAMDSMVLSARNLSNTLAQQAITEAFKGNFIGAAASGIGALVSGLFGSKKTSEEKQAAIKQAQEAEAERIRIETEANDKLIAEAKAAADEQLRIARDLHERQLSFQDQLFAATNDNTTLEGRLAAFEREANRAREQEAIAGNDAVVDLEASLAARRTRIEVDFAREVLEAEERSAKERMDALNGVGRNITDFISGLLSGSSATVSPQDRLTNAQATFNAKYALALGGNLDAQAAITQAADDLLKASRAFYGSTQGYQDQQTQVISQLLGLPAVTQSTDPIVQAMREVLGAINTGNATQALDATLQNVILAAINAGNAAAIAALLSPKFDQLNTTADSGLDFAEFVRGLGPGFAALATDSRVGSLLTDTQLRAAGLAVDSSVTRLLTRDQIAGLGLTTEQGNILNVFRELDGNGNGILERSELIRAQVVGVGSNTATENQLSTAANSFLDYIKAFTGSTNNLLDQLIVLNGTSSAALQLLNTNLTGGAATFRDVDGVTRSNESNMLNALRIMVVNTYAIATNTETLARATTSGRAVGGRLATGGLIHGPGTGTSDTAGLFALSNGEFVVNAAAAFANRSLLEAINDNRAPISNVVPFPVHGGGDSSAIVSELRRFNEALLRRLDQLEERLVRAELSGAGQISKDVKENTTETREQTREIRNANSGKWAA